MLKITFLTFSHPIDAFNPVLSISSIGGTYTNSYQNTGFFTPEMCPPQKTNQLKGIYTLSSRIDAAMRVFFLFFFFMTLLYLLDYFNNVLKRSSMKLAGTNMPFCK